MSRTRVLGTLALGVIIAILAVLLIRVRAVRAWARPTLICHTNECLLFVSETYFGWDRNVLRDSLGSVRAIIAGSDRPTDKAAREGVFAIAPTGVQQLSFRGPWYIFEVYANNIYARGGERPQVWTGAGFRPLTSVELERLNAARDQEAVFYGNFTDKEGWTSRVLNPGQQLVYTLNDETVKISMEIESVGRQRIQLQRGNAPPTTIWTLAIGPQSVTKAQYDELFSSK